MARTQADPDLWGYLAFGRLFWETGHFPYHDIFSYVPTLPVWVYHEWLTGVLFYPLYQTMGGAGMQLLKYALGLATVALIYLTARARSATVACTVLVLFLIQFFSAIGFTPVRAQVFTYCFFATSLYLLESARLTRRWRRLWLLVPLQVLWCNLHGGFLAGLGLMGLYTLGEACSRRPFLPYLRVLLLAGLATLINPYGWWYWQYLLQAISLPRPEITEWASVWSAYQRHLLSPLELGYILAVAALTFFLALSTRWRELSPLLCLSLVLSLGLTHMRHLTFFLLLVGAYLPARLTIYLQFRSVGWQHQISSNYRTVALVLALGALLPISTFLSQQPWRLTVTAAPAPGRERPGQYYPVGAVNFLRSHHLGGSLLTEFGWGEYLIWHLYPQCRVALDGRYETVYPAQVCQEYFAFVHGRTGWQDFLERYAPEIILIDARSSLPALLQPRGWQPIYRDAGSVLLTRGQLCRGEGQGPTAPALPPVPTPNPH